MPNSQIDVLLKIQSDIQGIQKAQKATTDLKSSLKDTSDFSSKVGQGLLQGLGIAGGLGVANAIASTVNAMKNFVAGGVAFNATVEQQTVAFRTLLGSVDQAEERIGQLVNFAAFTPFELPEIIQANKVLEVLSDGMLSTEAGMRLVGDAASSVGRGFRETAMWMGRLAAGLESGTAVGESTLRLIELGLISGKTAKELQFLAKEAHSIDEVWAILNDTFSKSAGAMELQSRTFNGLTATMRDTFRVLSGEFTSDIFQGIADTMEAILVALGALPSATEVAANKIISEFDRINTAIKKSTSSNIITNINASDEAIASAEKQLGILRLVQKQQEEAKEKAITSGDGTLLGATRASAESLAISEKLFITLAQIKAYEDGIARAKLTQKLANTETARRERVKNALVIAAAKREADLVKTSTEQYDDAIRSEHLIFKQRDTKLAQLRKANQTQEERVQYLKDELQVLKDLDAQKVKEVSRFRDPEKGDKVLEVFRAKQVVDRVNIELELKQLAEQRAKDEKTAAKEQVNLTASIIERKIDQIRYEKDLAEKNGETATSREIIRDLVVQEKAELQKLIDLWTVYGSTVDDPTAIEAAQKRIQGYSQEQNTVGVSAEDPTRVQQSINEFNDLGDATQHFQDYYGAAAAALMDYQTQVGTVADQIHDNIMSIQESFTGGLQESIEGLIKGTMDWQGALENVGLEVANSIVSSFAKMLAQWITTQITMATLSKVFGATAVGAAGIQASALAAAWAPAAVAASIATLGGAAEAGGAAFTIAQISGTATSTALAKGSGAGGFFAEGGYTGDGSKFDVKGLVHAGEFVMPADAVRKAGGPAGFQAQVDSIRSGNTGTAGVNMIVVDSRKSAERYFESSEGEAKIVDIMELNKGRLI